MQGEVNKDYNPRRQRIAVYRDPGGVYVYLVAVRLTVASSPYFPAGASSSPVLEARGMGFYSVLQRR